MKELDRCLELRRKISKIEEKLEDIGYCIRYPKSQTMSDMPKTTSQAISPIERYIMQQDEFNRKKLLLETELSMHWNSIEKRMISCNIDKSARHLMYLRFNSGYSWKKCTAIMKNNEGEKWNENKTFRIYRKVVKMLQENSHNFVENAD